MIYAALVQALAAAGAAGMTEAAIESATPALLPPGVGAAQAITALKAAGANIAAAAAGVTASGGIKFIWS